jgi:GTP cyclohydrolase I
MNNFVTGAKCILAGLEELGVNLDDNFEGTPERIAGFFEELVWPKEKIVVEINKALSKTFSADYNEMLIIQNIRVYTLCPHHLLPCLFLVNIGYVPRGKVLGLSKFARIAEALAKKPILQEQYTKELVVVIQNKLEPQGVAVYVRGRHSCMEFRGVKQDSVVTTSSLTGCFVEEPECRSEFYSIVKGGIRDKESS